MRIQVFVVAGGLVRCTDLFRAFLHVCVDSVGRGAWTEQPAYLSDHPRDHCPPLWTNAPPASFARFAQSVAKAARHVTNHAPLVRPAGVEQHAVKTIHQTP